MGFKPGTPKAPNAGRKKGTPNKKTVMLQKCGLTKIGDLEAITLKNWKEFLESKNAQIRLIATKEVSKYIFPQKREHTSIELTQTEIERLRQIAVEQMTERL